MLTKLVLIYLSLLQVVPAVYSDCSADPRCVPANACDACIKFKCDTARDQNLGPVDCSKISPLTGGNQCCDLNRVAQLRSRRKRQAYNFDNEPQRKWPIPIGYAFDTNLRLDSAMQVIPSVLSYIERQTCIRFTRVSTNSTTPYILFTDGSACTSYVGRSDFVSTSITVTPQCLASWGYMTYYIVQTLGMFHQSQRPDRDDYITLNLTNMEQAHWADFSTLDQSVLSTYGLPYDYASIQHYSALTFTKNGYFTILTKDPLYEQTIGQMVELSFLDRKLLNLVYCKDKCSPSQLSGTCMKGGYQDPNNCTQCKCPDGLAGQFCETYEDTTGSSCGGTIEASLTEMNITSPGYFSPRYYDAFSRCTWRIVAPKGGNIFLRFIGDFGIYQDDSYACFHWVEMRLNSMNQTGPRFCGQTRPEVNLTSVGNEALVLFRSNLSAVDSRFRRGFQIAFKIVNAPTCAYVTCLNGGTCSGGYCLCPPGVTGAMCEKGPSTVFPYNPSSPSTASTTSVPPSSCNPNPCRNNGTCSSVGGSVTCQCINGFSGTYCTRAPCGGCSVGPGVLDPKCIVPESPQRTCQVQDFVDTTSGWWFTCRTNTRVVTRNVTCTWAVCCDNATDFGYGCGVLGWTDWCQCPVSCGGGIQLRRQYGTRTDRIGNLFYDLIATQQQNCNMNKCNCKKKRGGRGRYWPKCTPCNGPSFVDAGDQCAPKQ